MALADAFAEHEERFKNQVLVSTWGHLAPKPRQVYSGDVLFTHGEYGDVVVIKNAIDIEDSPWFCADLNEFIAGTQRDGAWHVRGMKIEPGSVYRFTGTYTMFKNGNHRFSGKVQKVL